MIYNASHDLTNQRQDQAHDHRYLSIYKRTNTLRFRGHNPFLCNISEISYSKLLAIYNLYRYATLRLCEN